MKENLSITIPLYLIVATLLLLAFRSLAQPPAVSSDAGASYSYLQPQAGEATESGSKRFIDMRTGGSWVCNWKHCVQEGRFPLEEITETSKNR